MCFKIICLILIFIVIHACNSASNDDAKHFGKDTRVDKLFIKNKIGYHFKKVVREVSQELFVSRRINVSPLLIGIQALKETYDRVSVICSSLSFAANDRKVSINPEAVTYVRIHIPETASSIVARKRCEAKGFQLPEVYTQHQMDLLAKFLRESKVEACHAGLLADPLSSVLRFISTGLPVWYGFHHNGYVLTADERSARNLTTVMDDYNVRYSYTDRVIFEVTAITIIHSVLVTELIGTIGQLLISWFYQ